MTDAKQAIEKPEIRLKALALSKGIGVGRIFFLHDASRPFFRRNLRNEQIAAEIERFRDCLERAKKRLTDLAATETAGGETGEIFAAHLLMLDHSLPEKVETFIAEQRVNSEWAIRHVGIDLKKKQSLAESESFKEKALDIDDVCNHLLIALGALPSSADIPKQAIIVVSELRPSLLVELAKCSPAAIISEHGGWTSHSSILAREFRLPMVSGVRNIENYATNGEIAFVDGDSGEVVFSPRASTIEALDQNTAVAISEIDGQGEIRLLDGTAVVIRANIDHADAYAAANYQGADGIGLFRSESMLGLTGPLPSEDAQYAAYTQIAEAVGDAVVRIRTFDIGIARFSEDLSQIERNPSLGLRAIRLSVIETNAFRTQVRALLRASVGRSIDIVLPMITTLDEINSAKRMIAEEGEILKSSGIETGEPKIGAMIETPAAVFIAEDIAKNVDFLCLGTNDLVQYMLAVDRDNDAVADWYQTLHPAVLRAVEAVIASARKTGKPITACGEMAGSAFYLPVLVGLGAREFSINASSLAPVRRLISGITVSETESLVAKIHELTDAAIIESTLRDFYREKWLDLFPPGLLDERHI